MSINSLWEIKKNSISDWRFELKYRINYMQYHKLKIALMPYMDKDDYTRAAKHNRYLVRSLYFDTYDYNLYYQKMSGNNERVKFRLRTYSKDFDEDVVIRAEMKVRLANAMIKYGVFVSAADYGYFMQRQHWPDYNCQILNEFELNLHQKALNPKVLTDYQREGFEDRAKEGIRVTFDHKVRSAHSDNLFPGNKIFFREHHPGGIVFEIKCRYNQPYWLHNLIRDYGLKLAANSKFAQGIQTARQDLYYPNGVIVVR